MTYQPKLAKAKRPHSPGPVQLMEQGEKISPNISLCSDGKYRWIYAMSLFKNPTIFLLVWKIFFFITLGICAFTFIMDAVIGYLDGERLLDTLKIFGYIFLGMTALVGLGYLLYAAIMGGKYIVIFEMDDRGVNHAQESSQAKKAKKLGAIAAAAGTVRGSMTAVGAGLNARRTEMYSEFAKVRKVKACPKRHLIKVNGLLEHNQVYAHLEDFDFVLRYICDRVPDTARPKNM